VSVTFLATGFEPFAEHRTNSSWDALCSLKGAWQADMLAHCLPVDCQRAHEHLRELLVMHEPRAVLCTGLARDGFRIERLARRPAALTSVAGPERIEGSWPWQEMLTELARAGERSPESWDAGRYVCESTYWSLLSFRAEHGFPEYAAFLHVPPRSEEYPIERIARAIANVINARRAQL
jgi:pyroglutamyl-peptidase